MALNPRHEDITGADLTGSDGDVNRTYTTAYANSQAASFILALNGTILQSGVHFSKVGDLITFLNIVLDEMYISLDYWTSDAVAGASVTYCTAEQVQHELQLSTAFGAGTKPTLTTVNDWITQAEDKIDAETGHSWRETTRAAEFYHVDPNKPFKAGAGLKINLGHRKVRSLSSASGDVLYVWDGDAYVDYLASKTEGRADDFWMDYELGVLYLNTTSLVYAEKPVQISFRYGDTTVPGDITEAAIKLVCIRTLMMSDESFNFTDNDATTLPYDPRISAWKSDIGRILRSRMDVYTL